MCTIYGFLSDEHLELFLGLDDELTWDQLTWAELIVAPLKLGAFVTACIRVMLGQWRIIETNSPELTPRAVPKPAP